MFRHAYELASEYTVPVVISQRFHEGTVTCSVGTAVVLNDAGFILTAAHMLEPLRLHDQDQADIARYDQEAAEIVEGPGTEQGKRKRLGQLTGGRTLMRNCSYWFGNDGWAVNSWEVLPDADLAVGRLEGFQPGQIGGFPVFQDGGMGPGTMLCRLGFPFHNVGSSYDEATDRFALAPETIPIPRFPNEGILTRFQVVETTGPFPLAFIETSSPGLRGQSGGPIFDTDGHVWGIQSRTNHILLGFDPELEIDGRRVTEHQFMNVGVGTSSETVLAFIRHAEIDVATATT